MRAGRMIILVIGWSLVAFGFFMRVFGVAFTGTYLEHRYGWRTTTMNSNALLFFGLIFLGFAYFSKKSEG